ncbi:Thymidylate kinase [Salmonella phage SPFM12]|nr:Thymidylate kinase [Salmonella phage SPFM12]
MRITADDDMALQAARIVERIRDHYRFAFHITTDGGDKFPLWDDEVLTAKYLRSQTDWDAFVSYETATERFKKRVEAQGKQVFRSRVLDHINAPKLYVATDIFDRFCQSTIVYQGVDGKGEAMCLDFQYTMDFVVPEHDVVAGISARSLVIQHASNERIAKMLRSAGVNAIIVNHPTNTTEVALDGPDFSGKSTLAKTIQAYIVTPLQLIKLLGKNKMLNSYTHSFGSGSTLFFFFFTSGR